MSAERAGALALGLAALAVAGLAVFAAPAREVTGREVTGREVTGREVTGREVTARPADAAVEATVRIAMMRDFAGFTDWDRYPVSGAMLPVGVADGPTYIYANRAPDPARARWPVGTIFVKVIESGDGPADWTIHAMVKRGVPYNAEGAVGWEFFELSLPGGRDGDPLILWRGPGPPSGHGYASQGVDAGPDGIPLVCNDCHAASWRNDGVLTPALARR